MNRRHSHSIRIRPPVATTHICHGHWRGLGEHHNGRGKSHIGQVGLGLVSGVAVRHCNYEWAPAISSDLSGSGFSLFTYAASSGLCSQAAIAVGLICS